jgi:rhodanese-related sulfurtransferase
MFLGNKKKSAAAPEGVSGEGDALSSGMPHIVIDPVPVQAAAAETANGLNGLSSSPAISAVALPAADTDRVTIDELERLLRDGNEPVLLLDARSERNYLDSDLQAVGTVRIDPDRPVRDLRARNVLPNTIIVAFCACPNDKTSVHVAGELREAGWPRSYALTGGWQAWVDAGKPTEPRNSVSIV